jgi:hypothetical protein
VKQGGNDDRCRCDDDGDCDEPLHDSIRIPLSS